MKKLLLFVKKEWSLLLLFFVWTPLTYFNTHIYWMTVDDGDTIVFSRNFIQKLVDLNFSGFASQFLENSGRFRPTYWIFHIINWLIGGNSYQIHHFIHMLIIGTIALFLYLIVNKLTRSKLISLMASLFFLLTPLNTENILRLGPQEPLLTMLLAILIYLIAKNKNIILSCVVLILFTFSKETTVAFLPAIFFYYFVSRKSRLVKNKKQGFYLLVIATIASLTLILLAYLRRGGYSSNYYFDIGMFMINLTSFLKVICKDTLYTFPIFTIIYLLRNIINLFKKKKLFNSEADIFQFVLFASFILFLTIQLPWKYALSRYLMPAVFSLIAFSFIEIYRDTKLLLNLSVFSKHKRLYEAMAISVGVYVFLIWGFETILIEKATISYYKPFKKMSSLPRNTVLLINMKERESTIEFVTETRIHLSEFWGRDDIKVEYLDFNNLPVDDYVVVDSDQFQRAYSQEELNLKFYEEYTSIDDTSKRLIITTPIELIKQTVKKLFGLFLYKQKITGDGIFTYYYSHNNWYFYHE